jgi:hypothetical protein
MTHFTIPRVSADPAIEAENVRLHEIHDAGYEANYDGELIGNNPHAAGTVEHSAWEAGHLQAQDARSEWASAHSSTPGASAPTSTEGAAVSNIFDLLAQDKSVAPAFRRIFATPKQDYLTVAHEKAAPRRFTDDQPSAFGALDGIGMVGSLRWQEVRDDEGADQQRDERAERIGRGE